MNESKDAAQEIILNGGLKRRLVHELWEIVKVLLIAAAVVLPVRYFIAQPFIVRGASMEPNFENSEYLIIDEVSYYAREPVRGEAIVFRYPANPKQFFIKRVVGLPGEEVEIRDGRVVIKNGQYPGGFVLDEAYLDPPKRPTEPPLAMRLRDGEYFVMGDNRDASSDSRIWGPLKQDLIVGRAFWRVWPFRRMGFIPDFSLR